MCHYCAPTDPLAEPHEAPPPHGLSHEAPRESPHETHETDPSVHEIMRAQHELASERKHVTHESAHMFSEPENAGSEATALNTDTSAATATAFNIPTHGTAGDEASAFNTHQQTVDNSISQTEDVPQYEVLDDTEEALNSLYSPTQPLYAYTPFEPSDTQRPAEDR